MSQENQYSAKIKQMTDYYEDLVKDNTELKELGFHEMIPLLSESYFSDQIANEKLDEFLETLDSAALKESIKSKLIQLKKQIVQQKKENEQKLEAAKNVQKEKEGPKQTKEKGKIFQRLETNHKGQAPRKRVKVDKDAMKDEKKQKQHVEGGEQRDPLDKKEGLKRELQRQGKQKCRFFPFCKNEQTCEYFHPTQKVSNDYIPYKRVNKIYA